MGNPRFTAVLGLTLVVSARLWSASFWDKKPYQEWTDQEIAHILIDSPWAKEVIIRTGQDYVPAPPPPPPAASVGQMSAPAPNLGGGPLGPSVGRKVQSIPPGATVRVRWESATPLRQAIARTLFTKESAEATNLVTKEPANYLIAIDNIPPYLESARFGSLQAELLANATLQIGKRGKLRPTDVDISANKAGLIVRLTFPRTETITLADQEVTLETEAGVSGINCQFRLRDMVFAGKLAL